MALIFPFRGVRYSSLAVSDFSSVVTQPYDKITPSMQEEYYGRHPLNIVRIIKGKDEIGDTERENKYTRAGQYLREWIEKGILIRDQVPSIYAYYQEYEVEGERKLRKGFIALARLEEFGKGGVKPHEKTLPAPKQDRLEVMRHTFSNTEQIFMLYPDPGHSINTLLDTFTQREPQMYAIDEYGVKNYLWAIHDENVIKEIQNIMKDKELFIADGHHRYETAINFWKEVQERGLRFNPPESPENCMMTFVNMFDPGLTILPTHRLIYGLSDFKPQAILEELKKQFTIQEFPVEKTAEFLATLKEMGRATHCFGMYFKGSPIIFLLALKDEKAMDSLASEHSPTWKTLDVVILHTLILEDILGITPADVEAERFVTYRRSATKALEEVKSGKYDIAFILNPTKVEQVRDVATNQEKMPQKSTDFFPKLLSGMVLNCFIPV